MLNLLVLLAQADPLDKVLKPDAPSKTSSFTLQDGLMVMGITAGLAVILFLWVYFTRRKSGRHLESSAKALYRAEKVSPDHLSRRGKLRKRRRDHPDNLPRNPTLGETGGLPPVRSEEPNEPAS
jgi:hypothetical protein